MLQGEGSITVVDSEIVVIPDSNDLRAPLLHFLVKRVTVRFSDLVILIVNAVNDLDMFGVIEEQCTQIVEFLCLRAKIKV